MEQIRDNENKRHQAKLNEDQDQKAKFALLELAE
jgi:hypothetical protein